MKLKAVIWVEARRGLGHFRIASSLAKSLANAGCVINIATSKPENFDFFYNGDIDERQCELTNCDADFKLSMPVRGENDFMELLETIEPDIVIFEMWPMRRANYDDQIVDAITKLRNSNKNVVVCSVVRDIYGELTESTLARQKRATDLISDCINVLFVRGDGQIKLHETWPDIERLKDTPIKYLGYFGPNIPNGYGHKRQKNVDWIISMGGGWFDGSEQLIEMVVELHGKYGKADSVCKFYVPESQINEEITRKYTNIQVLGVKGSYLYDLQNAQLAILQAGYNSVIEALSLSVPAVFIPASNKFTSTEQKYRLERFLELNIIGGDTQWHVAEDISSLEASIKCALDGQLTSAKLQFYGEENFCNIIANQLYDKNNSV